MIASAAYRRSTRPHACPRAPLSGARSGTRLLSCVTTIPLKPQSEIEMGQIPPLLPTHRVSCVARIYSGIPPIGNEQGSLISPGGKLELMELTLNLFKQKLNEKC
jgi:hypothetical protein